MITNNYIEEISFPKSGKKIFNLEVAPGKYVPLYWSRELTEELIDLVSQMKHLSKYKKVIDLIDKQIIYPCRFDKSFAKFLWRKSKVFFLSLFGINTKSVLSAYIGGFYIPVKNRIFLIIDNHANIFNNVNKLAIELLIFHELSHYTAANKSNIYFSKEFLYLSNFYKIFFTKFYEIEDDISKEINKFTKERISMESQDKDVKQSIRLLYKFCNSLKKFSTLTQSEFKNRTDLLFYYLVTILSKGIETTPLFYHAYRYIGKIFLQGYKELQANLKIAANSIFYQEFLFPSEIPAIASTNPNNITTKIYMSLI